MKEFISNPKNRPIVIVIAAVVIVGVIVALLFETGVLPPGSRTASAPSAASPVAVTPPAATAPTMPNPNAGAAQTAAAPPPAGVPPGVASPGAVRTAAAMPPGAKKPLTASAKHNPKKMVVASAAIARRDPFQPAYDPKALKPIPPAIETVLPGVFTRETNWLPPIDSTTASSLVNAGPSPLPPDVVLGRVSGIILSNGVRAIYESDAGATIVQPGDELPDGNGRVQSIQADGITIRLTTDNRVVQIPVTAGFGNPAQNNLPEAGPDVTGA